VRELIHDGVALDHPATLFGPWEGLSVPAQSALRRIVEEDIRRSMDFFRHGDLWTGLIRGGWELDRLLSGHPVLTRTRPRLSRWINRLSGGPLNARNRACRAVRKRRWEKGHRAGPADLLAALERSPQWLLADFARGVDVDPRARGYFADPARNVFWGYMVGLDLVPTPRGICCVEANLQSGILDFEKDLFVGNPVVEGMLDTARAHGAHRVLWVEGPRLPLRSWVLEDIATRSSEAGVQVEVLEDPCMPVRTAVPEGVAYPNRWRYPPWVRNDTLVVRRNEFPVGSDYVINHKEPLIRGLARAFRETDETRAHVLPMTRVPHDVPQPGGPGLPNLVYKYPDSLAGRGVFFMKARDPEHALTLARELDRRSGEPPGLFQPFTCSRLLPGRRIYDVRTEIFLSPAGTWYWLAFKREGGRPLPDELPEGLVPDTHAFTSNLSTGGAASALDPKEEKELKEASEAVGEGLRRVLDRTFRTRPDRRRRPARW
jgi:hypothetical protein